MSTIETITELLKTAFVHHQSGQLQEAQSLYEEILQRDPGQFDALQLFGVLFAQKGEQEKALGLFDRALLIDASRDALHRNRAKALFDLERWKEAAESYQNYLQFQPDDVEALTAMGECNFTLGHYEAARSAFQKAIEVNPQHLRAITALAFLHEQTGDFALSARFFGEALALQPESPEISTHRAFILTKLGRFEEASHLIEKSLALNPDLAKTHAVRGIVEYGLGRTEEALRSFDKALEINPFVEYANEHKIRVLYEVGRLGQAIDAAKFFFELNPSPDRLSNIIATASHQAGIPEEDHFEEHLAYARRYEAPYKPFWPEHCNDPDPHKKIRVGLVSGDFNQHVVASLVLPVIRHLEKNSIELWAFSNNHVEDQTTLSIKSHVAFWRPIYMLTDDEFFSMVQNEGIDILVDLSGHTGRNRLAVFARKPAPVQVTWIGDPNTTGLTAIEYALTDAYLSPPGLYDEFWTEELVRVPAAATIDVDYAHQFTRRDLPALRKGFVTFASVNRESKIHSEVINAWGTILQSVPESRLLLIGTSGHFGDHLKRELSHFNVDDQRLLFKKRVPLGDYYGLHAEIDILLDSWPYSGGGTTAVGLGIGATPIVTREGRSMRHNQGAWLLRHLGLDDWVASTKEEYIEIAVQKASNLPHLALLRKELPDRWAKSALGSPPLVAEGVEKAFRTMWQKYCEGKSSA